MYRLSESNLVFWTKKSVLEISLCGKEKDKDKVSKVLFIIKVRSNFAEALKLSDIPFFRQKSFGKLWERK